MNLKNLTKQCLFWCRFLFLFVSIVVSIFIIVKVRPIEIIGCSMSPALKTGDRCVLYITQNVKRHDIICLRSPSGGTDLVKRVIGLPGEKVFVCPSGIIINDKNILHEKYLLGTLRKNQATKIIQLKKDEIFVLGDNRINSRDSMMFGPVKISSVQGVIKAVLFNTP